MLRKTHYSIYLESFIFIKLASSKFPNLFIFFSNEEIKVVAPSKKKKKTSK